MATNTIKMTRIKELIFAIDVLVGSVWGITLVDLIGFAVIGTTSVFDSVERWAQLGFAFVGIVYGGFRLYFNWNHKRKMNRLELDIKKQELEKLARENGNDIHFEVESINKENDE